MFTDGQLTYAALIKNPEAKARGPAAWARMADAVMDALVGRGILNCQTLVIEQQQIYASRPGYKGTRSPADILELTGVTGAVVGRVPAVAYVGYLPRDWKGTVNPDAFTARIERKLTPADRSAIQPCAASLVHNVLDSVGLGKHHLALAT